MFGGGKATRRRTTNGMRKHQKEEASQQDRCNDATGERIFGTDEAQASPRNLIAFACLGLLNNVVYAVSNASAGSVMPDAVAVVYIVNTAPGLAIKLVAPLWIDRGTYTAKILLVGLSLALNLYVLVLPGVPTSLKLLGIALGDIGSSAGEATCMGLTQFYAQPRRHISAFAAGTGGAGVCGWGLRIFVLPALGDVGSVGLGTILVLSYLAAYFLVLDTPWVDATPLEGEYSPQVDDDDESGGALPEPQKGTSVPTKATDGTSLLISAAPVGHATHAEAVVGRSAFWSHHFHGTLLLEETSEESDEDETVAGQDGRTRPPSVARPRRAESATFAMNGLSPIPPRAYGHACACRSSDEISLQKQLISDDISLKKQLISDEISLQKQLISDEISPQKQLISDEISPPQKQSIAFTRARSVGANLYAMREAQGPLAHSPIDLPLRPPLFDSSSEMALYRSHYRSFRLGCAFDAMGDGAGRASERERHAADGTERGEGPLSVPRSLVPEGAWNRHGTSPLSVRGPSPASASECERVLTRSLSADSQQKLLAESLSGSERVPPHENGEESGNGDGHGNGGMLSKWGGPPPLPPKAPPSPLQPRSPPPLTGPTAETRLVMLEGFPPPRAAPAPASAAAATATVGAAAVAAATTPAVPAAIFVIPSSALPLVPIPATAPVVAPRPTASLVGGSREWSARAAIPRGRGLHHERVLPGRYALIAPHRQRLAVSDPQLRRFPSLDPLMVSWLRSTKGEGIMSSPFLRPVQVELGRIKESVFGASQCSLASIALSDAELDRASHVLRGRDAHDGTTMCARMRLLREITIYMVPLFLVFWAEYACQSGAWTAFALPEPRRIDDAGSRLNAYHTFNLLYQCGVLISRASGMLFTLPRPVLHALVVLQVALLVGFVGDAATQTITGWPLHAGALTVGLIGGTLYVQMFLLIDREMPPAKREAALATCTCADTAGVLAGEFTGLFTQFCLFDYLNLLTRGQCPWSVTPGVPITLDLTAGLAGGR